MPDVVEAFARLQRVARQGGFGLAPYSAFRNFKTQKRICNHKCNGRKPLFDEAGTRTGASITTSKRRKRARRARCRGYGARTAAIRDQKVLEFKLDYNDALFDRSNIPRTGSYGAMVSNIGQASQTARC
jgi:D-alanyl-D-alanine carboxypeptidase